MFGKIIKFKEKDNKVFINFEKGEGRVEIISSSIINIFSPLKYEEHFSRAIENLEIIKTEYSTEMENDKIKIITEELIVIVSDDFKIDFYNSDKMLLCEDYRGSRQSFIRRGNVCTSLEGEGHDFEKNQENHKIEVLKAMDGTEKIYGLGDKTGHLNKKGYGYEMWNTDDPSPHVECFKAMYKSIPFFLALKDEFAYGIFFDNTFKSYFDMGKENNNYYYFGAEDGNLDYYFIYGPEMKAVIGGYTYLTGTTPIPQKWTLGYQQSRWSYSPESRVKEIADNFRNKDIPCDTIHLDIDYMDDFRVFTWDKERFNEPEKIVKEFKDKGFKLVTIIDPGVKKDKGYKIYDEGIENGYFATEKDGIPYVNKVWPGDSMFPDFSDEKTRKWWAKNQKIMMDTGVAGIWNDMNEPASFNGPLPDDVQFKNDGRPSDHKEIHNVYGSLMAKSCFEGIKEATNKRPFVITRACYAGTQKYSTVWTGDNQSMWEHLRMSIPMLLNLGLSGLSFCGTDVGGFGFDCTAELLSRWVQVGCFTPLFRNHSSIYTRDQEPWAFDKETEDINRKYIKLRYKLLPYLYDCMWLGEKNGLPIMRPLVIHYEKDKNTHNINDEFLFGENILVAPILEQGKNNRVVYLPEGTWIDYWTNEAIEGGGDILKEAPLETCPIYIKSGSIIPNYPEQNYVGEKKITELTLDIYEGTGSYSHYEDDGESFNYKTGEYNLYSVNMKNEDAIVIDFKLEHSGYESSYEVIKFIINKNDVKKIKVNGKEIEFNLKNNKCLFEHGIGDLKIVVV